MLKPRALRAGDRIGLLAASGSVSDPTSVNRAVRILEGLGFSVRVAPGCAESHGYLAGSDAGRVADLHESFSDDSISGIVCLKGGYGAPRILDRIDYRLVAGHPKVFVGYSDVTALHLAFNRLAGLVTFHGPMGLSDDLLESEPFSTGSWLATLGSAKPLGILEPPPGSPRPLTLVGGRARGPVTGGNLSLVAATMGTAYEIDTRGKLLFLEDVDERPYRVDRMLTQLRLAGKFSDCAGIILGDWKDCGPEEGRVSLSLEEIFREVVAPAGKPAIVGFRAGHCSPQHSFPLGVEALLDADEGRLEFLEAATLPHG